MRLVARLIFFWLSVMLIAGCTFFQDKDEEILPAELVKYKKKIKIEEVLIALSLIFTCLFFIFHQF